jgi:eukaryotic-like serine/threonine-protein kinase
MLPPGFRLGGHVIVREAAVGAMGEIYEGRHEASGRKVAVKVLSPGWCLHPEIAARFVNEGRALQELRHPHIVTVFECGVLSGGEPYLILEWLPANLQQALARASGPQPVGTAVSAALQLAEALGALHARGIVHRDVKPANVLLVKNGPLDLEIKLADLGLAKVTSATSSRVPVSTAGSALLGTWEYMSPEQWIRSKDAGPESDVYSLGVLLFQVLAGRLPFIAEEKKDLMGFHLFEPPPIELLPEAVPPTLRELVAGMLAKKPSTRPGLPAVIERLAPAHCS